MEINPATCFLGTFFRVRGILGKKACLLEAVELASWQNSLHPKPGSRWMQACSRHVREGHFRRCRGCTIDGANGREVWAIQSLKLRVCTWNTGVFVQMIRFLFWVKASWQVRTLTRSFGVRVSWICLTLRISEWSLQKRGLWICVYTRSRVLFRSPVSRSHDS